MGLAGFARTDRPGRKTTGKTRFPRSARAAKVIAMKPFLPALAFTLFLATALGASAAEPKLMPLFNGKDLTNFKAEESREFWRVENGVLIGENNAAQKGNYLWTQKEYATKCLAIKALDSFVVSDGVP